MRRFQLTAVNHAVKKAYLIPGCVCRTCTKQPASLLRRERFHIRLLVLPGRQVAAGGVNVFLVVGDVLVAGVDCACRQDGQDKCTGK